MTISCARGGYTRDDAVGVATKLLPDILCYDPHRPASFPHNGRTLTDDVVDVFFSMFTNGTYLETRLGRTAISSTSSRTSGRRTNN